MYVRVTAVRPLHTNTFILSVSDHGATPFIYFDSPYDAHTQTERLVNKFVKLFVYPDDRPVVKAGGAIYFVHFMILSE